MTRIDWIVMNRVISRVILTLVIFYGLILLVESLDTPRYEYLTRVGGIGFAVLGMVATSATWLIKGLPLIVLVGAVVGVVDLQSRRELTAIRSSGISIWRIVRAPALALLVGGLCITFGIESLITQANRLVEATLPGEASPFAPSEGFWLEQYGADGQRYVIEAEHVTGPERQLQNVSVFLADGQKQGRIVAPAAMLEEGNWLLPTATRYRAGEPAEPLSDYRIPTTMTRADLALKLTSTEDMTFYDLARSLRAQISDPQLRDAALTRFLRLLSLPALLVGALFIAFAFTAGYRRAGGYGRAIVYAVLVGFVVFVITEMADRAGSAGTLDPMFAACGPAFVAVVIGVTVLLYREDGWA